MAFSDLIYSQLHFSTELPNITYFDLSPASYVLQGSDANIICVATGSPPPAITWTLNGQPTPYQSFSFSTLPSSITCDTVFPGVAASYLLITSISSSGNYTCNATNINGSSWQSVYIEVQGNEATSSCINSLLFYVLSLPPCSFHSHSDSHLSLPPSFTPSHLFPLSHFYILPHFYQLCPSHLLHRNLLSALFILGLTSLACFSVSM